MCLMTNVKCGMNKFCYMSARFTQVIVCSYLRIYLDQQRSFSVNPKLPALRSNLHTLRGCYFGRHYSSYISH